MLPDPGATTTPTQSPASRRALGYLMPLEILHSALVLLGPLRELKVPRLRRRPVRGFILRV